MILPIMAFGSPILKTKCHEINSDFKDLNILIQNMWETMYAASGVGLAAPQIGKEIRLFIVDASPFAVDKELSLTERSQLKNFKKIFINPQIVWSSSNSCNFNEGCLSIPDIREDIKRDDQIEIHYQDEKFKNKVLKLDGLCARVVQHEYDHIEGVLFTDKLSSFKKKLLKKKLKNISLGKINCDYPMSFFN
jgi:peptide deformylase|tara:strand:+ start:7874 stop:8449 length:576 start_codon:yes stop_codon:yes gene_type:complete